MKRFTHIIALTTISIAVLVGCSSNDDVNTTGTETTDPESRVTKFDGTWRAECVEYRLFMVPEEDQPGGYVQRTLTIDSITNSYSDRSLAFTDSQCTIADSDDPTRAVSSGDITIDGLVTTDSGMEANVVRYVSNGTSPDLTGLLYRDGDVLYRDARESTLIEDVVPVKLALSDPWQLVN